MQQAVNWHHWLHNASWDSNTCSCDHGICMIFARKLTSDAYRKDNSVSLMDCLVAFSISGHHSRDCPCCLIKPQVRHQASTRNVPSRSLYPLNLEHSRHCFSNKVPCQASLAQLYLTLAHVRRHTFYAPSSTNSAPGMLLSSDSRHASDRPAAKVAVTVQKLSSSLPMARTVAR